MVYLKERGSPPFSGGHDLTNPDRGFWHFGGGPWLTELPLGGESDDGPLHKIGIN